MPERRGQTEDYVRPPVVAFEPPDRKAQTWRFRAVKPGRETVHLEYRRPWDDKTPPERTFTFTAEVQP